MTTDDPAVILIILLACIISGSSCFIIGARMQAIKAARREKLIWADAERLYRARTVLDLRDTTPRP